MRPLPRGELSRQELRQRLLGQYHLIRLYYHGYPIEELERLLAASYRLAELYAQEEFCTRRASRYRDPRDYWINLHGSRYNWGIKGYKPPAEEAYGEDTRVSLCDRRSISPRTADALRQSALAVYPAIQEILAKYRT